MRDQGLINILVKFLVNNKIAHQKSLFFSGHKVWELFLLKDNVQGSTPGTERFFRNVRELRYKVLKLLCVVTKN